LNKVFIKKHKKDIDGFKSFLNVLLKEKVWLWQDENL
jgi:hypothetical protein